MIATFSKDETEELRRSSVTVWELRSAGPEYDDNGGRVVGVAVGRALQVPLPRDADQRVHRVLSTSKGREKAKRERKTETNASQTSRAHICKEAEHTHANKPSTHTQRQ